MTGLISGISGHFSRRMTLGTLLPVVAFILLLQTPLIPQVPQTAWLLRVMGELEPSWRLAATSFLGVALAGFLYVLNVPIIRIYEGYTWQNSWLGKRRTAHYRRELERSMTRHLFARFLRRHLTSDQSLIARTDAKEHDRWVGELRAWEANLARSIFADYPKPASVLPTRLGNTIRSFENYPHRQYRMSGITMWPRLAAQIPGGFAETIDSAKTRLDFMLNCSLLSLVLALIVLSAGLLYAAPFDPGGSVPVWLASIFGLSVLSGIFYRASIGRAASWGETVKTAFDLYRSKLLEDLGFRQKPATLKQEQALWQLIRYRMQFGELLGSPRDLEFVSEEPGPIPSTFIQGDADPASFEIARGVSPLTSDGSMEVFVQIRNTKDDLDATDVVLVDSMPTGFDYRWDSARIDGKKVEIEGVGPCRFRLGKLPRQSRITLSYSVVRRNGAHATLDQETS